MSQTAEPGPKPAINDLGFDPAALKAKYRAERDKRLRADGNGQYREIKNEFAHYLDDPYVEPGFTRAPLTDEIEVLVIGFPESRFNGRIIPEIQSLIDKVAGGEASHG